MSTRIPATIVSGFLGAGKTSLVRHVLEHAERHAHRGDRQRVRRAGHRRRHACAIAAYAGCEEGDIVELANGCLCCTVADEFLPAMQALLDRANVLPSTS